MSGRPDPADGPLPVVLTDSQRRHIAVFLAHLEGLVLEIEQLADSPGAGGRLLRVQHDDLPAGFLESIQPEMEAVRGAIHRLVRDLQLEPSENYRSQTLRAILLAAIVGLEDAGSRGLKGYGSVHPSVPAILDPLLQEVNARLRAIAARLGVEHVDPVGEE